ncbi:MAG: TetR/AcrR family transcriptional regulator [Spirochaetales bacterium]|nr:TetR/AcrR family transcriptional regulator [Spirochaetales bacterium]
MEEFDYSQLGLSDKEERIFKASIEIFSKKGFDGATTYEIARHAGVAEGTIFKYFKTKKGLMKTMTIKMIGMFSGKMILSSVEKILANPEDKNLRQLLKELLFDRIKLVDSLFPAAKILLVETILHEDVREAVYTHIVKEGIALFAKFQKTMIAKKVIREDLSPETIFRSIFGNIAMIIAQRKLFPETIRFTNLETEVETIIDIICRGIEPE